jgi:glyoxylase-like metal-dependent hydrolase (beta-lactamase superfamily II)
MTEQIRPDLFRIEIPLPGTPLKALNSYLIKGDGKDLIIDTGFNCNPCFQAMQNSLHELRVDLSKTDFFITHRHVDHIGLVSRLATESSIIYYNRPDAESKRGWDGLLSCAVANGFPENQLASALQNNPGFKYGSDNTPDFKLLEDGDKIDIGDYHFICVQTPGHTRGHMCLYDASKKLLLSGDHILNNITPNIMCFSEEENPLNDYLTSLERVYKLDVNLILPGHRRIMENHRERIEELKTHHRNRADEVLKILQQGSLNAFQIASQMTWDITYSNWDMFPVTQKWFATGEALAHVRYLENSGMICRDTRSGVIHFSRR